MTASDGWTAAERAVIDAQSQAGPPRTFREAVARHGDTWWLWADHLGVKVRDQTTAQRHQHYRDAAQMSPFALKIKEYDE